MRERGKSRGLTSQSTIPGHNFSSCDSNNSRQPLLHCAILKTLHKVEIESPEHPNSQVQSWEHYCHFLFFFSCLTVPRQINRKPMRFCVVCVDCIVLFSGGIGNLSLPARRCRGLFHMLFCDFYACGQNGLLQRNQSCRDLRAGDRAWPPLCRSVRLCYQSPTLLQVADITLCPQALGQEGN